ncbi:MAG: DOMON-like domain-containing protein [Pseudomonadota bacterium]
MVHALTPHPDFPCRVLSGLEAEVARPAPDRLRVRYRLSGITGDLVFPPSIGGRADELWRHTCLEAFVRTPGSDGYRELNLSPGGQWAAYRFDGYRAGMANAEVPPPEVSISGPGGDVLEFTVEWTLDLPADADWQVAVTAVIEASDRTGSYWSIRHPEGRPDFHHADGFVVELRPPSAA